MRLHYSGTGLVNECSWLETSVETPRPAQIAISSTKRDYQHLHFAPTTGLESLWKNRRLEE
jgi:hypothetical protein